ncbi:MAG: Rpn family recombination-promoting nuclease/putative transposase [Nitrospirae bacterium]|nr:Rpn family recombination-promoting nuclease/putative transposase [Magnetococcales bacterium]
MTDIAQPHDRLFKALMSHPETAGALLQEYLPPEVARLLAPEPPQLVEGSFVEENLRPYYSDRLFQTKTISGKPACFYVLIEHKSFEDEKVGWQIFRGISAFLEQKTRENEKWQQLPAVLALLVYNGAHEWRTPNEFLALVDADEALHPWLLNFRFPVVDLGPIPDRELSSHARLRAGLMALKYGTRDPESQMAVLDQIADALVEAPQLLLPVLLYLLTTFHYLNEERVRQVVRRIKPEEEYEMMSQFVQEVVSKAKPEWAQIVRQEGIQIGEQKGEQKGEAKMLTRQLQRRFGIVPEWANEKITKADLSSLEEWSLRFVDAQSLEDVFSDKV